MSLNSSIQSVQQELLSLAECPVCFEFVVPPILQCRNGHIACASCRPRCHTCPSCRDTEYLWGSRNLSLERIVRLIMFPCRYTEFGCQHTMGCFEKAQHEHACLYRPFVCPCPGPPCAWTGTSAEEVVSHLESSVHPSVTSLAGEEIVFLATEISLDPYQPRPTNSLNSGQVNWVMMQRCFDHDFILILQKQRIINADSLIPPSDMLVQTHGQARCHFYCCVQVIARSSKPPFIYRLELSNQENPNRKVLFQSVCRNVIDGGGIQGAIEDGDCLSFNEFIVQKFACKPQPGPDTFNLPINVTIKRSPHGFGTDH